jgi:hypothetical protein
LRPATHLGDLPHPARRHAVWPRLALWHIGLCAVPGQLLDELYAARRSADLRSARDRHPADCHARAASDHSTAAHSFVHTTFTLGDGSAQCHAVSHADVHSGLALTFSDRAERNTAFCHARGQRHASTAHSNGWHHAVGHTAERYCDTDIGAAHQHSATANGNSATTDKHIAATDKYPAAADKYPAATYPYVTFTDCDHTAANEYGKTFSDAMKNSCDIASHAQTMV